VPRVALRAALLGGLVGLLAACADGERLTYLALVGEAPGDKPLYTGSSPSVRLGRPPPGIPEVVFRPPVLPDGPTGAAAEAARAARQVLSDRASDYELRVRYLRLNAGEFLAAVAPLKPVVGQPMQPDNARTQARITAAREAMARIQGDVLSIYGIVQRSEQTKAQAERALAAVRAAGAGAAPLAAPLGEGIASIEKMMQAGGRLVAAYVEWMGDQRTALDTLEDEIKRGVAVGPAILQRESIIQ
jgi:hypothetical protein